MLGFNTVLNVVRPLLDHAEVCPMSYRDQEQVLEYAGEQVKQGRKCVVCCWGDLNVSARELLERVQRRADSVRLVPGISSVQVAMARTGIFSKIRYSSPCTSGPPFDKLMVSLSNHWRNWPITSTRAGGT